MPARELATWLNGGATLAPEGLEPEELAPEELAPEELEPEELEPEGLKGRATLEPEEMQAAAGELGSAPKAARVR